MPPSSPVLTQSPSRFHESRLTSALAGIDGALMVIALGLMYSLIMYAALGPAATRIALFGTTTALLVGGGVAALFGRNLAMVAGPTATGALVLAAMIQQLQSVPGAAGRVDAALLATALTTIATGLLQLGFARARLGTALKFVPYPVLMGFVNAVGLSLIISVMPFALGHETLGKLMQADTWFVDWKPWSLAVTVMGTAAGYGAMKVWPRLPGTFIALVVATLAHHGVAATCATCALGPRVDIGGTTALPDLTSGLGSLPMGVAWWALIVQTALTLAILNSLFSLLVAAYLTKARDRSVDGNELLRMLGAGTVSSGLTLGIPVALITSVSLAVREPRTRRGFAIASYLVATGLVYVVAKPLFDWIPMAAVASSVFVIARTQFDASTWTLLRQVGQTRQARRAARGPLVVVALVVAVALLRSLASALFLGSLAAVCLLALEMRRSVVLNVGDGRTRRSRHVRTPDERAHLDTVADQIRVIELGHWLYFGTADELSEILEKENNARWLLIDAHRVAGIDLTAARSLMHAAQRLKDRGEHLVLTGLPKGDPRRRTIDTLRTGPGGRALVLLATLDDALERAEATLLAQRAVAASDAPTTFLDLDPADNARLAPWLTERSLARGETLFRVGDPGDTMYVVRAGRITLWAGREGGARRRLLTFGAGGLFGEMALLDRRHRSADAEADVACRLLMLTRERMDRLASDDPGLHARLLDALSRILVQRLRETNLLLHEALR